MMSSLKSELRKLLSVRSTFILITLAFALIGLINYFGTSASTYEEAVCASTGEVLYSLDKQDPRLLEAGPEEICDGEVTYTTQTINDLPKEELLFNLQETVPLISTFIGIVVILLMAHEFRYFTINHTLTASNSRSKVLLSKLLVSTLFAIIVTLLAIGFSVAVTYFAVSVKNLNLPAQDYDWLYVVMRHLGLVMGYTLFGLGIITLVRNLTAGIAAYFMLSTINALIAFTLLVPRDIEPTKVLPISALERFGSVAADITNNQEALEFMGETSAGPASVEMAGLVVIAWLIGLWLIAWWLFLRRDAN